MTNTQEITLILEQLNSLIQNFNNKDNNSDEPKKRKGNIQKLKSGSYRFRYQYNNKLYSDTFDDIESDEEAEKTLEKWVEEIEIGTYQTRILTVSSWCQTWLDKQVKPNSSGDNSPNNYANFLNNWFLPKFGKRNIKSIAWKN